MNYNNIMLINQEVRAENLYVGEAEEGGSEAATCELHSDSLPTPLTLTQKFETLKYDKKRQKYSLQLSPDSFNNSISSIRAFRQFRLSNSAINLSNVMNLERKRIVEDASERSEGPLTYESDDVSVVVSIRSVSSPNVEAIIKCLRSNDVEVQFNAAAYLQHITYQNEENKEVVRKVNGIRALISLLSSQSSTCQMNAASVLRNLSYGPNNQIKIEIQENGGIEIIECLLESCHHLERKFTEALMAILCNISSTMTLQIPLVDSTLDKIVQCVFLPLLGIKINPKSGKILDFKFTDLSISYNTLLEYITAFLKNLSSGHQYIRQKLRHCEGLLDSVIAIIQHSSENGYLDTIIVENCACIIRNLCYALQEVVDPDYLSKKSLTEHTKDSISGKSNLNTPSSFNSRRSNDLLLSPKSSALSSLTSKRSLNGGMIQLWGDGIIDILLVIINDCVNNATVEAAIGAVQNLAACDWKYAEEFRFNFRKKKGLPALVIQLNNGPDSVINVVLAAFRNLGEDSRNLDLIGKHCLYHLIRLLPSQPSPVIKRVVASGVENDDLNLPEEYIGLNTIYHVLSFIYFVMKSNQTFCTEFVEMNGVNCCIFLLKSDSFYKEHILNCSPKQSENTEEVPVLAANILRMLWSISDLGLYFRKEKLTCEDLCVQTIASELKASLSCSQKDIPKANSVYYGKPYVKARNNSLIPWTLKLSQRHPNASLNQDNSIQRGQKSSQNNGIMPNFFLDDKNDPLSQPGRKGQKYSSNTDLRKNNNSENMRNIPEHQNESRSRSRAI